MKQKHKVVFKITTLIFWIIIIIILSQLYKIYKLHYYNGFTKAEYNIGISNFTRDDKVKYSKYSSYKIESDKYNDAIFYKSIKVTKQTPYKLSCMVKTENVKNKEKISLSGVSIGIVGTTESTQAITGTTDWQKIEFLFNSKDREELQIGFRLRRK